MCVHVHAHARNCCFNHQIRWAIICFGRVVFMFHHPYAPEQPSQEHLHLVCLLSCIVVGFTKMTAKSISKCSSLQESYMHIIIHLNAAGTKGGLEQQCARNLPGALSNSKLTNSFPSPKLHASLSTGYIFSTKMLLKYSLINIKIIWFRSLCAWFHCNVNLHEVQSKPFIVCQVLTAFVAIC
jgi:hypothetical protein